MSIPSWGSKAKCTWCSWLCNTHVASSASSFSKCSLPVTGMSWEILDVCTTPVPHLAFKIPGSISNASLCSSPMPDVGWGIGICGTLLCCSWTISRIACCFSSRVERSLISSDWDFICLQIYLVLPLNWENNYFGWTDEVCHKCQLS